jgi:hypothetical protein
VGVAITVAPVERRETFALAATLIGNANADVTGVSPALARR